MIYMTASDLNEARRISSALLEKRLVACANIIPSVESHYHWQGKVEEASEVVVIYKTQKDKFEAVAAEIKGTHSYEVPAIVSFDITEGDPAYLKWIEKETSE